MMAPPEDPEADLLIDVDLSDLEHATIPDPQFAVESLVPRRVVTLASGHGGGGKSTWALTLCAHVAAGGKDWADLTVDPGKALFVSLEDEGDLALYRLKKLAVEYCLNFPVMVENIKILDGSDADAALMREAGRDGLSRMMETRVWGEVVRKAEGCSLIVVDNASDGFDGNEIVRREVRPFIRMLTRLARKENAGVILLAHIDKAAAMNGGKGNTYSGSTAWHNSVRSRIAIEPDRDTGRITLKQEKSNFGPLLKEAIKMRFDGPVLVVDNSPTATTAVNPTTTEAVLEAIRQANAQGTNVPANKGGSTNTYGELSSFLTVHGIKKDLFYLAVQDLLARGLIRIEDYKRDGHERKRLVASTHNPVQHDARAHPHTPYMNGRAGPVHTSIPTNTNGRGIDV